MKPFEDRTNQSGELARCTSLLTEVVPAVMRIVRLEVRRISPEFTVPQFRAMAYLKRHPLSALSTVTGHVGLSLPTMSKMIDGLVERRFVERQVPANDRRCISLRLTAEGESTLESVQARIEAHLAESLAGLSAADLRATLEGLLILQPLFASPEEKGDDVER
jgi:DNA-binding MarR family transcriptional regulator